MRLSLKRNWKSTLSNTAQKTGIESELTDEEITISFKEIEVEAQPLPRSVSIRMIQMIQMMTTFSPLMEVYLLSV
jgi:hypothetical protein